MVLVVDVDGECWISATWRVISISTDLISMISSPTHFTNAHTWSCRCWHDVGIRGTWSFPEVGPPIVVESPKHGFLISPLLCLFFPSLPPFSSSFLLSSPRLTSPLSSAPFPCSIALFSPHFSLHSILLSSFFSFFFSSLRLNVHLKWSLVNDFFWIKKKQS